MIIFKLLIALFACLTLTGQFNSPPPQTSSSPVFDGESQNDMAEFLENCKESIGINNSSSRRATFY